jgi:hypothetical protein
MKNLGTKFLFALSLIVPLTAPWLRGSETIIVGQPRTVGDEATFRDLENQNALAMLHLDYAALERLWSERLVVNTPTNMVAPSRAAVFEQFRRANGPLYASYEKKIECIVFDGDVTIVMGSETVEPHATPGKTVQRRYTNIWKLDHGAWHLIARQATVVPKSTPSEKPSEQPPAKG